VAELAPLRSKLLAVRDRRPQPARDDKIVVSLNGLAIASLARAGKNPWRAAMDRVRKPRGEFLWQHAFDEKSGRLRHHIFRGEAAGEGFLDDYAMLGLAYLASARRPRPSLASRAQVLASAIMTRFVKPDGWS
jgi:uncharacterized protein YyaL (SSP411 family)